MAIATYDFMSGAYIAPPTNLLPPKRRYCLVCQRYTLPSAHPLLCLECDTDHAATVAFIADIAHAVESRVERTMETYDTAQNSAASPLQARLAAYHVARQAGSPKAAQAEQQARTGRDEPLLHLIRLWLDYQDAGESYATTMTWVRQCEETL